MMNDENCPLHGYLKVSIPVSLDFESNSCMYQNMLADKEACHSCAAGSGDQNIDASRYLVSTDEKNSTVNDVKCELCAHKNLLYNEEPCYSCIVGSVETGETSLI